MAETAFLTFAIPTYNRAAKLDRLLGTISEQLARRGLLGTVEVLVTDNASADETPAVAARHLGKALRLRYFRQPRNLGFDGALRFLYEECRTPYLWLFADDDLPFEGSFDAILDALRAHEPALLLYSFMQPPGSPDRTYAFAEPVHLEADPVRAIELVLKQGKVSGYVLRRLALGEEDRRVRDRFVGEGWLHHVLAFGNLEAAPIPRVAVISEQLATCDAEYNHLPWTPAALYDLYRSLQHPFPMRHAPGLWKRYRRDGYCWAVDLAYHARTGVMVPSDPASYERFIRDIPWRLDLLHHRKTVGRFLLMKLGLVEPWLKVRPGFLALRALFHRVRARLRRRRGAAPRSLSQSSET